MKTTTEIIAKEGWKPIGIALLLVLFAWLLQWKIFGFFCLIVFLCLIYFYRNTERIMEDNANDSILAPLDGIIKNIENQSDGIYLQIHKPICFCGTLRMPLANLGKCGEALKIEHIKGLKNGDKITGERIKIAFSRQSDADESIILDSKATLYLTLYPKYFSQISLYLWDSNFKLGERIGFFLNGNAILKIPLDSELRVNINDKIIGGKTLLAKAK
ncbi:hypothetical protein [uncultured Helicobacter sp.]|uniref:hypothetical protein n=1 Tax=uncultured Helicobacter sp. TaxID=175537 RepID=UPI0026041BA1|nr:hypothetical protein [uncultured Helicobacter sp.]